MTVGQISSLVAQRLAKELGDAIADEQERLRRRRDRLIALKNGDRSVKKIRVEGHWVKRHWVGDHDRIITAKVK